ncbi:MAG TPA: GlsB/YeaQ/YmgE family stress response membrane protein [Stellaceae bacterium]|nr:GlsB/YeaQ/YmgE family stress response membrane protein [Stellaceae bacterium]
MSTHSLLVMLVVGLVAGWLAGKIVRGTGFGLVGDLAIGIIGAFLGNWLFLQFGVHLAGGIVGAIVTATIGAVVLLLIVGLLRHRSRWYGGGWGRRWGNWGSRRFW